MEDVTETSSAFSFTGFRVSPLISWRHIASHLGFYIKLCLGSDPKPHCVLYWTLRHIAPRALYIYIYHITSYLGFSHDVLSRFLGHMTSCLGSYVIWRIVLDPASYDVISGIIYITWHLISSFVLVTFIPIANPIPKELEGVMVKDDSNLFSTPVWLTVGIIQSIQVRGDEGISSQSFCFPSLFTCPIRVGKCVLVVGLIVIIMITAWIWP